MPPILEPPPAPPAPSPKLPASSKGMGDRFKSQMTPAPVPSPAQPTPPLPAPVAGAVPDPVKPAAQPLPEKKPADKETNFRALEAKFDESRAQHEARVKELAGELETTRTTYAKEKEAWQSEKTKFESFMDRFALERSDKFKAAFDVPMAEKVASAKELLAPEKQDEFESIIGMAPGENRNRKIRELAKTLEDPIDATMLRTKYDEFKELQKKREVELTERASANVKALNELEQRSGLETREKKRALTDNLLNDEWSKFSQVTNEFKEIEGQPEHNAMVAKSKQLAKDWLSAEQDDANYTRLMLYAVKGYNSLQTDALKDSMIARLQQQVAQLTQSDPNHNGGGKPSPPPQQRGRNSVVTGTISRYQEALQRGLPGQVE